MTFDTTIRRVRTLQPDVNDEYFDDDVQVINQRQILNDLRLAISCWEPPPNQFSLFFLDELTISRVVRQIVTAVVVKTQKVRCQIAHEAVPYDGSKLHDDPLPKNLRKLRESRIDLNFPLVDTEAPLRIRAGEFLSVCESCYGATRIECESCKGAGGIICTRCGGSGQFRCGDCNGSGERMMSATVSQQCQNCSGTGTSDCRSCAGMKMTKCGADQCEDGTVPCSRCKESGKMRNVTFLIKKTYVKIAHKLFCKNEWVDSNSELATDLSILRYKDFDTNGNPILPSNSSLNEQDQSYVKSNESTRIDSVVDAQSVGDIKIEMLRDLVPEYLRRDAIRLKHGLTDAPTGQAWDLGTRFELRAGYVYHVVVEHFKQSAELFVSGCSNTVTLYKAPEQPKGLGRKLARRLGAFWSDSQVQNSDHVDAVRVGDAFLSDVRLIGLALREFGLKVSLNPDGYDVILPEAPDGFNLAKMKFNCDDYGNTTLQSSVLLGDADRDCFSEALMLGNMIPVGQIALHESSGGSLEKFFLVYRQPYETASPPRLAFLLDRLISTAYQIRKSKRIGLSL